MKKILFATLALGMCITSYGQKEYKKRPSLGVSFHLNDFKTAANLRSLGMPSILKSKEWQKTSVMNPGLSVSYWEGLNDFIDFSATLSGSYIKYPVPGKALALNPSLLLEAVATANLKLMSDQYWVTPFLTAGIGASKYMGYYSAILPVGVGLQVNIIDETFLTVNSQYRVPVTENASYHFFHSVGVVGSIKKKPEPAPIVVPIPVVEAP